MLMLAVSALERSAALFEAATSKPKIARAPKTAIGSPASEASHGAKPNLSSIIAGCDFVRHCVEDAAALPEPHWKAFVDIAARCEDGRAQVHSASEAYAGYSASETDAKVDYSLAGPPPRTCVRRQMF